MRQARPQAPHLERLGDEQAGGRQGEQRAPGADPGQLWKASRRRSMSASPSSCVGSASTRSAGQASTVPCVASSTSASAGTGKATPTSAMTANSRRRRNRGFMRGARRARPPPGGAGLPKGHRQPRRLLEPCLRLPTGASTPRDMLRSAADAALNAAPSCALSAASRRCVLRLACALSAARRARARAGIPAAAPRPPLRAARGRARAPAAPA